MSPLDLFVGPDQALIQNLIQETFIEGVSHAEAETDYQKRLRLPYYLTAIGYKSKGNLVYRDGNRHCRPQTRLRPYGKARENIGPFSNQLKTLI